MIPGIKGDIIHVTSVVDFWMGEVDQRIFGQNAPAPPKEKNSPQRPCGCQGRMTLETVGIVK